ncbi:hypothetical protein KC19_2G080400 [Ceratodon purpureus]|uniref:Uncharacterized protein n=1 Tax=Ceratodon purpureus TaxID=3225 RepID=A0A8T0IRD2_CERPU|nr:hypothetical protein KC19_2G080400 [Ceratodon purpureus]
MTDLNPCGAFCSWNGTEIHRSGPSAIQGAPIRTHALIEVALIELQRVETLESLHLHGRRGSTPLRSFSDYCHVPSSTPSEGETRPR